MKVVQTAGQNKKQRFPIVFIVIQSGAFRFCKTKPIYSTKTVNCSLLIEKGRELYVSAKRTYLPDLNYSLFSFQYSLFTSILPNSSPTFS